MEAKIVEFENGKFAVRVYDTFLHKLFRINNYLSKNYYKTNTLWGDSEHIIRFCLLDTKEEAEELLIKYKEHKEKENHKPLKVKKVY